MALDPDLLAILRCPKCRGTLALKSGEGEREPVRLECSGCRLAYPVVDDIPQLLVEEAQPLGAA